MRSSIAVFADGVKRCGTVEYSRAENGDGTRSAGGPPVLDPASPFPPMAPDAAVPPRRKWRWGPAAAASPDLEMVDGAYRRIWRWGRRHRRIWRGRPSSPDLAMVDGLHLGGPLPAWRIGAARLMVWRPKMTARPWRAIMGQRRPLLPAFRYFWRPGVPAAGGCGAEL